MRSFLTGDDKCGQCGFQRRFRSCGHPALQVVPLHTQFGRGPIHTFFASHLDSCCPQCVRYRRLSLAILSPFLEARFRFFERDCRSFASRHGLPPRRSPRQQIDLNSYGQRNSCRLAGRTPFIEAEGELRYREFQPNGSDAKIRTAEINAISILALDRAEKTEQEGENAAAELSSNDDTPF
jgi:hypothetical protein